MSKTEKVETEKESKLNVATQSIFGVQHIDQIVLQYLSIANNLELFLNIATNDYFKHRMNFEKEEIDKIAKYIQINDLCPNKLNLSTTSIFFSTIKTLFGNEFFEQLLTLKFDDKHGFDKNNIFDHYHGYHCTSINDYDQRDFLCVTLRFVNPINIIHIFNDQQIKYLNQTKVDVKCATKFQLYV